jgi:type VI secretion system protein ImpF
MARTELERTVQYSLLDRLIDNEPQTSVEAPMTWAQSVRMLKASVRRDLEWLLNTRRINESPPDALSEVAQSLYNYGLPDITSLSRDSTHAYTRLLRQVERAIALFEPRLSRVRVSLVETEGENARRELRFLVEAVLRMDPNPEPVVFDTVLEFSSGEYEVKGDARAG